MSLQILSGMDNSVLFIYMIILSIILFLFWNVVKFIMEKQNTNSNDINRDENNLNEEQLKYHNVGEFEECPICTERVKYKVELDCRHNFCGECIINWYTSRIPSSMQCPICRNVPRLINAENLRRSEQTREFYDQIVRYNHKNLQGWNYVK
jgi:hypothetical protein